MTGNFLGGCLPCFVLSDCRSKWNSPVAAEPEAIPKSGGSVRRMTNSPVMPATLIPFYDSNKQPNWIGIAQLHWKIRSTEIL